MTEAANVLSPETVLSEMKKNGVTDVVWLPDSETNWLYVLMNEDPTLDLIPVSREGQAFSTAAGLAVGGKRPIILIQNTGMMESGDSLRGWGLGLNVPVVMMVSPGSEPPRSAMSLAAKDHILDQLDLAEERFAAILDS